MRRPERIEECLKILGDIWKHNPDLRLGQIISVATGANDNRLWIIEDDILLRLLNKRNSEGISYLNILKEIQNLKIFQEEDLRKKF